LFIVINVKKHSSLTSQAKYSGLFVYTLASTKTPR